MGFANATATGFAACLAFSAAAATGFAACLAFAAAGRMGISSSLTASACLLLRKSAATIAKKLECVI